MDDLPLADPPNQAEREVRCQVRHSGTRSGSHIAKDQTGKCSKRSPARHLKRR